VEDKEYQKYALYSSWKLNTKNINIEQLIDRNQNLLNENENLKYELNQVKHNYISNRVLLAMIFSRFINLLIRVVTVLRFRLKYDFKLRKQ
jgi:dynactin complex subunit